MEDAEVNELVCTLLDKLLEQGVPPTSIADAWDLDPFEVKDRLNTLRIKRYGAAELSEAMAQLQWEMIDTYRDMMQNAPYNVRARFLMNLVSKTMSLTARQNPETIGNMRQDLMDLMHQMGSGTDDPLADEDVSAFVPAVEANEDQDEGLDD